MGVKTIIIYATVDGQTKKISEKLGEVLSEEKHAVQLISIDDFAEDLNDFDKVVIGSSIRYGKHNKNVLTFITNHKKVLEQKKSAFFSVNLVARKAHKSTAETNPYVKKFLESISWKPEAVGVFAGMLDYKRYSLGDRLMIQLIMLMTNGPVNPKSKIEYTDWQRVEAFGKILCRI